MWTSFHEKGHIVRHRIEAVRYGNRILPDAANLRAMPFSDGHSGAFKLAGTAYQYLPIRSMGGDFNNKPFVTKFANPESLAPV